MSKHSLRWPACPGKATRQNFPAKKDVTTKAASHIFQKMPAPFISISWCAPERYFISLQLLSMSAGSTPQTTVTTSCCESGRPIMTDPTTGQTVCSCQYSSASLLSYPARLSESVYSSYAAQGYVPFGADPSAFYSPLVSQSGPAWKLSTFSQ